MSYVYGPRAARAFHCPTRKEVSGQGTGGEPGSSFMDALWTTCSSVDGQGFDYWQVSTTLRGCPQVIHRLIHRMAATCGLLKVIHNSQVRGYVRRAAPTSGACGRVAKASYPQAEVIHRSCFLWKTHTPWSGRCPQVGVGCAQWRPPPAWPARTPTDTGQERIDGADLTTTRPGRIFFMLMPMIVPALV